MTLIAARPGISPLRGSSVHLACPCFAAANVPSGSWLWNPNERSDTMTPFAPREDERSSIGELGLLGRQRDLPSGCEPVGTHPHSGRRLFA